MSAAEAVTDNWIALSDYESATTPVQSQIDEAVQRLKLFQASLGSMSASGTMGCAIEPEVRSVIASSVSRGSVELRDRFFGSAYRKIEMSSCMSGEMSALLDW